MDINNEITEEILSDSDSIDESILKLVYNKSLEKLNLDNDEENIIITPNKTEKPKKNKSQKKNTMSLNTFYQINTIKENNNIRRFNPRLPPYNIKK